MYFLYILLQSIVSATCLIFVFYGELVFNLGGMPQKKMSSYCIFFPPPGGKGCITPQCIANVTR